MDDPIGSPNRPAAPVVLARPGHSISRQNIDPNALKVVYRLHRLGFTAYVTGGAVRDLLLGRPAKDFDVVTNARPGQIKKRFANAYVIGRRFRLVHVHFSDGKTIEVATFRRSVATQSLRDP
jgi:poly(A) polymerase